MQLQSVSLILRIDMPGYLKKLRNYQHFQNDFTYDSHYSITILEKKQTVSTASE